MALLVVLPLILAVATALAAAQQNMGNITLRGCPTRCGDIDVRYPFGFLPGCYRPGFQLTCNTSGLFIDSNLTAIDMPEGYICDCESQLDDGNYYVPNSCPEVVTLMSAPANCQRKCGDIDVPFPFGLERGCYRHENFSLECTTSNYRHFPTYGDTEVIKIMIGEGKMRLKSARQTVIHTNNSYSVYDIDWVVGLGNCTEAKTQSDYPCISNDSYCFVNPLTEDFTDPGYNCGCEKGYHGNPYTHGGCQDINECIDPETYGCYRNCTNLLGSFICACGLGIHSNCADQKTKKAVLRTIFICKNIGFGLLLLFFCGVILHKKMKQRIREKTKQKYFQEKRDLLLREKTKQKYLKMKQRIREKTKQKYFQEKRYLLLREKTKQKYFQENRDLLHQQKHSTNEIAELRIKFFSLEDLEKATNNFDSERIVGSGSYGRVYKGILSDQRVVAIKKSMRVTAIEQFINEISILSIVNHRNVVKLFGCCLETEVPLLVFEFVTNGSLSDHLHGPLSDQLHAEKYTSSLSWDDRLRIATETAGALAYLHSAASISIFHGDVKTANILLDGNFSAKVSDFGTSRSRPVDKTRVLTLIKGTDGYLDPEYQYTSQLTEKSDVYSFGVILVELLTGEMPISFTKCRENMNLCMSFLQSLKENRLVEILEPIVTEGALTEELDAVAKLAEACLNIRGKDRPTMKEVFARLESLIKAEKWKPELIRRESQEEIEYHGEQSDKKIIRRESQEEIEYYGEQSDQKTKQVILRGVILYKKMKQRIRKKISQKYIQENSDLLRQMQSSNDIAKLRIRIFSLKELEKATNNFDSKRCVGCGSNGRVYKGILSDQRVVAIKKSKRVEATEILRFINEISILSIVNHRNVVKLFGCCLETEVPLLVFEFITNGSLFDHLHVEKYTSSLSWDDRLRIATETAGALAYLHSAASFSIFHGDVKTANILLDDNFSAKVSDFGTSRFRPAYNTIDLTLDRYVDPGCYHTGRLTEKSDVYSFGVILVELLTGEMPSSFTKCTEDMNLCMSFLQLLKENRLVEILEPIVTEGALTEQLDAVAKLAEACLNIRGEDRPTMMEVFSRLESLIKAEKWKPELIRRESREEEIEYDGEQFVLEL